MTSKSICSILIVALSLGTSIVPDSAIAQSPNDEAATPTRLWIETDTEALGERGIGMQVAVTRECRAAFEAEGVELVDEQHPNAVHLRLRFAGTAEDVRLFNYFLHFELVEGKTSTKLIEPVACSQCFADKLYGTIAAQVPALLEALEAELETDPGLPITDTTPPPGDGDGDGDSDPVNPRPKPIGPLGGVGIGVVALGFGAVVWGSVDLARGNHFRDGFDLDTRRTGKDYTPRGQALLGAGLAGLVVGGALLVTDLALRSKKRKQARQQTGMFAPTIAPHQLGLGWIQRF